MCELVEASPSVVVVLGKRTVLAAALEISPSFPYRGPVHGILFLADGDACGSFLQTCRGLAKRSRCAWLVKIVRMDSLENEVFK